MDPRRGRRQRGRGQARGGGEDGACCGFERRHCDRVARADRADVPRPVERAILRRYDDAKLSVTGTRQINGVTIYDLKAATGRGDIDASVTEGGDVLILGYPGVTEQTLPPPVRTLLSDVFPKVRPEEVEKFERTSYSIDLDMGGRRDVRFVFRYRYVPSLFGLKRWLPEKVQRVVRLRRREEHIL